MSTEVPAPQDNSLAAEKVRSFPQTPGVYLMKDAAGRVIYIGKAKNLRSRAGSYFLKAAAEDSRIAKLVLEIRDIDYLEAQNEIDALLTEARLIKDILPKFNKELRDSKTFPYLEIYIREDYPRIHFTREPKSRGTKLYGPFSSPRQPPGRYRCCKKYSSFAPAHWTSTPTTSVGSGSVPACCTPSSNAPRPVICGYRKKIIAKASSGCKRFWTAKKIRFLKKCTKRWKPPRKNCISRKPHGCATRSRCSQSLDKCGVLETHVQPEVFPIDPKKGLSGLQKVLHLPQKPRIIEGVDIAHTAGMETVASVVQFIDGLPFQAGLQADADSRGPRRRRFRRHTRSRLPAVPSSTKGK